jgi:hypothetical protein
MWANSAMNGGAFLVAAESLRSAAELGPGCRLQGEHMQHAFLVARTPHLAAAGTLPQLRFCKAHGSYTGALSDDE